MSAPTLASFLTANGIVVLDDQGRTVAHDLPAFAWRVARGSGTEPDPRMRERTFTLIPAGGPAPDLTAMLAAAGMRAEPCGDGDETVRFADLTAVRMRRNGKNAPARMGCREVADPIPTVLGDAVGGRIALRDGAEGLARMIAVTEAVRRLTGPAGTVPAVLITPSDPLGPESVAFCDDLPGLQGHALWSWADAPERRWATDALHRLLAWYAPRVAHRGTIADDGHVMVADGPSATLRATTRGNRKPVAAATVHAFLSESGASETLREAFREAVGSGEGLRTRS